MRRTAQVVSSSTKGTKLPAQGLLLGIDGGTTKTRQDDSPSGQEPSADLLAPKLILSSKEGFEEEAERANEAPIHSGQATNVLSTKDNSPSNKLNMMAGGGMKATLVTLHGESHRIELVKERKCGEPTLRASTGTTDRNSGQDTAAETDRHAGQVKLKGPLDIQKFRFSTNPDKLQAIFKSYNLHDCLLCHGDLSPLGLIGERLRKKYMTTLEAYNGRVVNDIVFNEHTHIVSVFKDYLIYDDTNEFLRRYYTAAESSERLPKVFEYYDKYTRIFPNYNVLNENKHLFKNIERKQRLIDQQQQIASVSRKKSSLRHWEETSDISQKILTTGFLNVVNAAESGTLMQDASLVSVQSGAKNTPSFAAESTIEKVADNEHDVTITPNMNLQELVAKIAARDSMITVIAKPTINKQHQCGELLDGLQGKKMLGTMAMTSQPKAIHIGRSISRANPVRGNSIGRPTTRDRRTSGQLGSSGRASSVPPLLPVASTCTRNPLSPTFGQKQLSTRLLANTHS